MDGDERPCPSPSPYQPPPQPPPLLKDISNFKTPKRPSKSQNFHSPSPQFFTASKRTPRTCSSFRRPPPPSSSARSKSTARRLKAFAIEQSQSSRKAQIQKEQSLKSLSKSLTVWLNFLFRNPRSCGCDEDFSDFKSNVKGKRDNDNGGPGSGVVGVELTWRSPKRLRDCSWRGDDDGELEDAKGISKSKFAILKGSFKDVCSLDDLVQRMRGYLSLSTCKEIFNVMTQVTKNIDEGRLKMKPHCPIVTDVGMKNKATRILMCYNPIWLRIGLYVIFGGDSLLSNEDDVSSDKEMAFLKMIIEKQFFCHAGLAKSYAYNKNVEGLYRPGYYETLGNVLLKRILLLVLILDRAKTHTSLPLKFGIDGVDGGSPLLFTMQSSIKSSREVIHDFLSSDIMHGEGNLLAHLVIVGYKVSYQQCPLIEYDFRVTDIFEDLQDGVRLCRAIQLLQHDPSILLKLAVPSDTRKKNLANCCIALQYLKQAGVMLCDEDGMMIMGDDVANGDKELILSLLWNIFVHLQLPLLINKTAIVEEISKIRGFDVDNLNSISSTPVDILLKWIQAVCEKYDFKVDNFSSLVDGKAIWCLLDYYFRRELCCACSFKDPHEARGEESIVSATDYTDAVHNFILSQKMTALLGNFPEVLQISDLLEHNGATSDRSVVILLVFLSSQLIVKKNMDQLNFHKLLGCNCQSPERRHSNVERWIVSSEAVIDEGEMDRHGTEDAAKKFKAIQAWWRDLTEQNYKCVVKSAISSLQCSSTSKHSINIQRENAAKVIQSHYRRLIGCRNFLKMKNAVCFLQTIIRAWLTAKQKSTLGNFSTNRVQEFSCDKWIRSETFRRHFKFIVDRHGFVKLKRSVLVIQRAARIWIAQRHQGSITASHDASTIDQVNAIIVVQKCIRGWIARSRYIDRVAQMVKASLMYREKDLSDLETEAAVKIQLAWNNFVVCKSLRNKVLAATKIQSHFRGWLLRRRFLNLRQAIIKIQSEFRCIRCSRAFQQQKIATGSAITIQSHVRGWFARRVAWRRRYLVIVIQSQCRGWLVRKDFLLQREAAIKIQSAVRCLKCWKAFHCHMHAAIEIQSFIRGHVTRHRLLGASSYCAATRSGCNFQILRGCFQSFELAIVLSSVSKLQKWWKGVMLLKLRTKSAIIVQCHIRRWIARRKAFIERHRIVVIQSYWKGYLARKESKGQVLDLRLRVQKSATNVDDSMRIINRLVSALSELLSMKSVSGILHTCATLDMATKHSRICCEKLAAAGAVDTLLKLIRSVSRSIPDQEVLKHALSTLRNLAHYPHLVEVIIDSHGSIETILWELLRNKEEGFFIASEILKKICLNLKGVEAIRKLPALLKRLQNLVEELTRKASIDKRNGRGLVARENTERRLREAVELLKLTTNG